MTKTSEIISCSETRFKDGLRMLIWQFMAFFVPTILIYMWTGRTADMGLNELYFLGTHNDSNLLQTLWQNQQKIFNPEHRYTHWDWLMDLHNSKCPFLRLLLNAFMALPIYNFLLILIGWHLNSSTGRSAEQIVLIMRPDAIKQTSVPPPAVAAPPSAPPRRKARKAPKPPPRRHSRISKNPPESYPCHMDPFGTITCSCDQTDRYKSLRRNLARVLEGLQQPLPPATTLSLSPFSMSKSFDEDPLDLVEDPALSSPRKVKSRKWTHGLLKRLSKPFAKNRSVPVETKASELSSSSSGYQSNPSQPFWQRLKSRKNRKSQFYVPSSSSGSETISSNSCLYAAY